jgi:hypothetical protein
MITEPSSKAKGEVIVGLLSACAQADYLFTFGFTGSLTT